MLLEDDVAVVRRVFDRDLDVDTATSAGTASVGVVGVDTAAVVSAVVVIVGLLTEEVVKEADASVVCDVLGQVFELADLGPVVLLLLLLVVVVMVMLLLLLVVLLVVVLMLGAFW